MASETKYELRLTFVSIFMALAGCIADVLLLYEPNAKYEAGDYLFLLNIDQTRLLIGSLLGVATIPFYLSGIYILIFKYIQEKTNALLIFICCVYIAVIGCVYHSSIPLVAYILKASDKPSVEIEKIRIYFDLYAAFLGLAFFLFCIGFGIMMHAKKEYLLLAANPIVTYFICVLFYICIPSVGRILLPTAFNLSIAVLMMAMYRKLCTEIEKRSKQN